jgi:hypothetical protein
MKIIPGVAGLFHAYRRTDKHDKTNIRFCYFSNAPKNPSVCAKVITATKTRYGTVVKHKIAFYIMFKLYIFCNLDFKLSLLKCHIGETTVTHRRRTAS